MHHTFTKSQGELLLQTISIYIIVKQILNFNLLLTTEFDSNKNLPHPGIYLPETTINSSEITVTCKCTDYYIKPVSHGTYLIKQTCQTAII